ncbi:MAG: hypothetical protein WA414_03235 [Acidobacteriaceae bacterium]
MLPETHTSTVAEAAAPVSLGQRFGPAILASLLYVALTTVVLLSAWRASDHHFIYALDDTYIGMAMAKSLALHGVWGVTPFAFSSSDSSLLFPILLGAAYRLFGVNLYAPLVLSWVFGLLSIFVAQRILAGFLNRKAQTVTLLLLVLFAPLFVVGVIGMEHSLHLLLTLLFLEYFLPDDPQPARLWKIAAITALMVASRYEGLFFVAPACCILAIQRRWKPALAIFAGAALPVCAYAIFSIAHGAYWLPNSVALKGAGGDHPGLHQAVANLLARIAQNFQEGPQLFLLLAGIALAAAFLARKGQRAAIPLLLVLGAGTLHILLAQVGMYYRYDAYLFAAGIIAIACTLPALKRSAPQPAFIAAYLLFLVTGGSFLMMSVALVHMVPLISRNIYLRQWQMGLFVHDYYPNAYVAANDIGAVNYLSNIHCYDLVGLANQEIFFARRSGRYTTQFLRADTAALGVQIAIPYDRWFGDPPGVVVGGPPLPSNWIRVAHWRLDDPSIIGDTIVSFYAVDPAEAPSLRAAVMQFAAKLPPSVHTLPN